MNKLAALGVLIGAGGIIAIGPAIGPAGAAVTDCGSAGGYAVSVEDTTTSCGFGLNVARQLGPSFAGRSTSVTAQSPTTGRSYTLTCIRQYQQTLSCTGGNGAVVYLNG